MSSIMTKQKENWNALSPEEERVILRKGTEMPFTGEYENFYETGFEKEISQGATLWARWPSRPGGARAFYRSRTRTSG